MAQASGDDERQAIASVPELYGSTPLNTGGAPSPLEPETYKAVCEFHGRDVRDGFPQGQFDGRFVEFSPEELMVRQDLAKNKCRWSNDYYADRVRFLDQMNPVLATWRSHRLHPISHQERAFVYIIQIFFVLLVSLTFPFAGRCGEGSCFTVGGAGVGAGHQCVFPFTWKGETHKTCTTDHHHQSWCSVKTDSDGNHIKGQWGSCFCQRNDQEEECWKLSRGTFGHRQIHAVLCCFAHHTGVPWFAKTFNIWGISFGGTLYGTVLNTIFSIGSFQLMICGCVQRASPAVRQCGELTGHVIYAIATILILLPQPYLILFAFEHRLLAPTLGIFISSKVFSSIFITLLQVLAFHFLWQMQEPVQKDKALEDAAGATEDEKHSRSCMPHIGKFHVTSAEYEAFLEDRRKHGGFKLSKSEAGLPNFMLWLGIRQS